MRKESKYNPRKSQQTREKENKKEQRGATKTARKPLTKWQ